MPYSHVYLNLHIQDSVPCVTLLVGLAVNDGNLHMIKLYSLSLNRWYKTDVTLHKVKNLGSFYFIAVLYMALMTA